MFERLNYLYHVGKITAEQLEAAVSKAWITTEQEIDIIG